MFRQGLSRTRSSKLFRPRPFGFESLEGKTLLAADAFAAATDLGSAALVSTTGSNVGFTGEAGEPAQSGAIQSAWWKWTAPTSGTIRVDTFGSSFDTYLTVASGSAVNSLAVLAQNDDLGGLQSQVDVNVTQGITYYVAVDGFSGITGPITLHLTHTPSAGATSNDQFSSRISLGNGATATGVGNNSGFGTEAGEPSQSGTVNSAWWQWTAPANGTVTVDTFGSGFDTFLSVFQGTQLNALTVVGQNDDAGGVVQSSVQGRVNAGAVYQIAVDGYQSLTGPISLHVNFAPDPIQAPPNDNFGSRTNLGSTVAVQVTGTNAGATSEIGEIAQSGAIHSAWWQWTAPGNGFLTVDTLGSGFDTFLSVGTGNAANNITLLGQNDDASGTTQSLLSVPVTAGGQYQIAVDGKQAATGPVTLNLLFTAGQPPVGTNPDNFSGRTNLGSVASTTVTGTNVGYTGETGEPEQSGNTHSRWYQWTAPGSGTVTINTFGSNFDSFLTIATGQSVDALTVLQQNDDAGGTFQSEVEIVVVPGTTYMIAVDGFLDSQGAITLNLFYDSQGTVIATGNDAFADAINLGSAPLLSVTGTNVGFTGQPGEPSQSGIISSAWWKWTAPGNGSILVNTFGSSFSPFLTIARGTAVNNLQVLSQTLQTDVNLTVTQGTTYYFAVDGLLAQAGLVQLNLAFTAGTGGGGTGGGGTGGGGTGGGGTGGGGGTTPNNDLFANRINLGTVAAATATGTNVDFSGELNEPPQSGIANSAWWQWTAPANGTVVINTFGSNFDTFLTVGVGTSLTGFTLLAQNDDTGGSQSQVSLNVVAGTTYQIAVDGFAGATGSISLGVSFTP